LVSYLAVLSNCLTPSRPSSTMYTHNLSAIKQLEHSAAGRNKRSSFPASVNESRVATRNDPFCSTRIHCDRASLEDLSSLCKSVNKTAAFL
jgi:hypothetical protein